MMVLRSRREAATIAAEFVTTGDIAKRINVKRNVVSMWVTRKDHFPDPVREFGGVKVWWWPEIKLWIETSMEAP